MKKNLNIIQIKGFRGILYIAFLGCCFVAGFGWFPGWTCMKLWNILSVHVSQIPQIGLFQGILLWGIIAASYFTFRKEKLVVCMKTSEGLNEDELKTVFDNIKKQTNEELFLKNLLKAREAELKIKNLNECDIPKTEAKETEQELINNSK